MNPQNPQRNRTGVPASNRRGAPQGNRQPGQQIGRMEYGQPRQGRRPPVSPPGAQDRHDPRAGWSQPQTIQRPVRPYGENALPHRPSPRSDSRDRLARAQEMNSVRMPVQCCVPMYRKKKKRWPIVLAVMLALLLVIGCSVIGVVLHRRNEEARSLTNAVQNGAEAARDGLIVPTTTFPPDTTAPPEPASIEPTAVMAVSNAVTRQAGNKVEATHAIVIDVKDGTTIAERLPDQRIFPASMTKVMTLIVAYEEIDSFDQTFTFTADLINPLVAANASRAGFVAGETVPVIDLLYAAALPSGADATTALAELVAGSEAAFAELMNLKAAEMGLTETHFVNASGLHHAEHYSTVREIAAIFSYAMQIEPLREIMSAYQYTTTPTPQNPEGLLLTSTLFAYLSGDELPGMKILAGKTGYTLEAKRCLVSLAVRDDGREYIAVVVGGENKWIPITDSIELYAMCLPAVPADAGAETAGT